MNYAETIEYLFNSLPIFQRDGKVAYKKDLKNTIELCNYLNQPQKKFSSIHIAGTNGKGSTAHMLASIFQEAGYKTGLYTSPHLKDFRERIKINGKMVSEENVVEFVKFNKESFEKIQPSFFEWTVALAFYMFAMEKVDIAIVETGMGGRLDSTNIITPVLSIITNISLDHTQYLGNTVQAIAAEKAGIIKQGIPVVIGEKGGVAQIFIDKAKECNSELYFAEETSIPEDLSTELKGNYQSKNLKTIYTSWKVLNKLGWILKKKHLYRGCNNVIKNTSLRGRWEITGTSPLTVLDTAHNEDGIKEVLNQISKEKFARLHIVLGMVSDKEIDNILQLFPKNAAYYFCAATIPRALPASILKEKAEKFGLFGKFYPSVQAAISASKSSASEQDMIYIGGSTFVVAEAI